jgi:hypothetical protein
MLNVKQPLYLLACLGAALLLWALVSRVMNAETLTFKAYGLEIKAEGQLLSPPPAKTEN